jgi:hypothetical protein
MKLVSPPAVLLLLTANLTKASAFALAHPIRDLAPTSSGREGSNIQKARRTVSMQRAQIELGSLNWMAALRGGAETISDNALSMEAFDWLSNLGAPAALVAGAVLATLSQTREDLSPRKDDESWIRFTKKACRALLLSSFAMEVFCIFVTTVTGTMLLSHGDSPAGQHAGVHYNSAMGFLFHNHEFEYLAGRVTFLQGLLNWLLAIALEVFIPKANEGVAARKMNLFISSSLISMIILMLKFYNDHMTFYQNYFDMLMRFFSVTFNRYFWKYPPRPLAVLATPWIITSVVLGWQAFRSPPDLDD